MGLPDDLTEAEALYERVKTKLDAATVERVDEQRAKRAAGQCHQYGHDLHAALARAEFNARTEAAGELVARVGGNVFSAFHHIVRAVLEADQPTKSGETVESMLERALNSALSDLQRDAARVRKLREAS